MVWPNKNKGKDESKEPTGNKPVEGEQQTGTDTTSETKPVDDAVDTPQVERLPDAELAERLRTAANLGRMTAAELRGVMHACALILELRKNGD